MSNNIYKKTKTEYKEKLRQVMKVSQCSHDKIHHADSCPSVFELVARVQ